MDRSRAVDAAAENRPGVPMELSPPAPVPTAPRDVVAQRTRVEVLVDPTKGMTPVFGTAVPPRGLSGAIRRFAYRYPDYRVRRWMLLLLADRVDARTAMLSRVARSPLAWALAGALALTTVGVARARRG